MLNNLHPEIIELLKSDEVLEPETLRQLYSDMTESDFNQIMALKLLRCSRGPWEDMFVFENTVQALSGRVPDPKQIEGCLPEEVWYGLETMHRLFPDREISKEVILYAKYFLNQAGVYIYPSFLDIPNPYYAKAVYLAEHGPWPLGETTEEIQAAKLMAIQEAIKKME
jgi:hypothetical protein